MSIGKAPWLYLGETDPRREGQAGLRFAGKMKATAAGTEVSQEPHPWHCGSHFALSPGKGPGTPQRQLLWPPVKRLSLAPSAWSPSLFMLHKAAQACPNGRCYLHLADREACAPSTLGLCPTSPPTLHGHRVRQWCHKHWPGLLLPTLSFISQPVLPLGVFWRGPHGWNEQQARLRAGLKGPSTPCRLLSSPWVSSAAAKPASDCHSSVHPDSPDSHPSFAFLPTLFSFWSY